MRPLVRMTVMTFGQERYYKPGEVIELAGCSRDQLSKWRMNGLVRPSKAVDGRGEVNLYTIHDCFRAFLAREMLGVGIPGHAIARIFEALPKDVQEASQMIVVTNGRHYLKVFHNDVDMTIEHSPVYILRVKESFDRFVIRENTHGVSRTESQ